METPNPLKAANDELTKSNREMPLSNKKMTEEIITLRATNEDLVKRLRQDGS